MANTNEAIENVRSLARVFQSVIDLAEALGDVANVEQTIAEKRALSSRAAADLEAAQGALEACRETTRAEYAKAKEMVDQAVLTANATVQQAAEDARGIMAQAQADKAAIADEMHNARAQAEGNLSALREQADNLRAEIQTSQAKLDAIRVQAQALFGG
jgi:DNA repair exonuclease SbcCD ATPase subunit